MTMLRRFRRDGGQGLVEFAVIFPLVITLIMVIVDGGIAMGRYNDINNSTKEGARYGAVGADTNEIVARVKAQAHGLLDDVPAGGNCGSGAPEICVEWLPGPGGTPAPGLVGSSVRVIVRYDYELFNTILRPLVPDIGMSTCAVQRMERPVSPDEVSAETEC
jgi:Flp pilus assembly protein TadG